MVDDDPFERLLPSRDSWAGYADAPSRLLQLGLLDAFTLGVLDRRLHIWLSVGSIEDLVVRARVAWRGAAPGERQALTRLAECVAALSDRDARRRAQPPALQATQPKRKHASQTALGAINAKVPAHVHLQPGALQTPRAATPTGAATAKLLAEFEGLGRELGLDDLLERAADKPASAIANNGRPGRRAMTVREVLERGDEAELRALRRRLEPLLALRRKELRWRAEVAQPLSDPTADAVRRTLLAALDAAERADTTQALRGLEAFQCAFDRRQRSITVYVGKAGYGGYGFGGAGVHLVFGGTTAIPQGLYPLAIETRDDHSFGSPRGSARGAIKGCALRCALTQIVTSTRAATSAPVTAWLRSLTRERWREELDDALRALSGHTPTGERDDPALRHVFRVSTRGDVVKLELCSQRRSAKGKWSAGQVVPPSRVREVLTRSLPELLPVAALVEAALSGLPEVVGLLRLLVGRGLVFLDGAPDTPLELQEVQPQTTFVAHDAHHFDVCFELGPRAYALPALHHGRGAAHALAIEPATNTLRFGLLTADQAALSALRRMNIPLPDDARDEIARKLASLPGDLRLSPALQASTITEPAPTRFVLSLASPGSAVSVTGRLIARVFEPASDFPPGGGIEQRIIERGGVTVLHKRDLVAEAARANAVLARLGLPLSDAYVIARSGATEVLALLQALANLGDDDVAVEWIGGAPQLFAPAALDALHLQLDDAQDYFGLSGFIEVQGVQVPLARLLEALANDDALIALGEHRFLPLTPELRERLQEVADVVFAGRDGSLQLPRAALPGLGALFDGIKEARLCAAYSETVARLRSFDVRPPNIPVTLRASLRPYQEEGVRWLARLATLGFGGVLADDMGLGKTLQALAMLLLRRHLGPALVVAPTSVCFNWAREAERFAPDLRVHLASDLRSKRAALPALGPDDVLVASYGLVVREAEALQEARFATLVVDEAQAAKNPATKRARTLRDLGADWVFGLSGTPMENRLQELWSLLRITTPGLLGSWEQFRQRFANPIEKRGDGARREALARLVRPYILRRTKAEVAPELPARTEIRRDVELEEAERQAYELARLAILNALAKQKAGSTRAAKGAPDRRFEVLAALTRLRQLACHPGLVDARYEGTSSKLEELRSLVGELRAEGHRALIFSQFTQHLALVRAALEGDQVRCLYLDGATPAPERARLVDAFQAGEGEVFLISLKAGGTGLNLTAASYVVHMDPWWNPAAEDQATDRAHRIGQDKPVTVIRLVSRGTIEDAILSLHEKKRALVASVLGGADVAGALSTDDLVELIRAGGDIARA